MVAYLLEEKYSSCDQIMTRMGQRLWIGKRENCISGKTDSGFHLLVGEKPPLLQLAKRLFDSRDFLLTQGPSSSEKSMSRLIIWS